MKKLIYYAKPCIIALILVYLVCLIKYASFNPIDFGYKTRIVLSIIWFAFSIVGITIRKLDEPI